MTRAEPTREQQLAAFEGLGDPIAPADVPAAVRAGRDVWSFAYGADTLGPWDWTTLDPVDLVDDPDELAADLASWAPFRVSRPPVDDLPRLAGADAGALMAAPVATVDRHPESIRAAALAGVTIAHAQNLGRGDGPSFGAIADAVLDALSAAGVAVIETEYGVCPDNWDTPGGPHVIAPNLCAFCLQYDPD